MRARVIKIGNSQGVRISKPILEQTGIMDAVEIDVEKNMIIIRRVKNPQEGWDKAFNYNGTPIRWLKLFDYIRTLWFQVLQKAG
jgi:antitoxin MazE